MKAILKMITKWYVAIGICVVYFVSALVYFNAIKGLVKPAKFAEAWTFLLDYPKEYALCLVCGGLTKVCFWLMALAAVASLLELIWKIFQEDDFRNDEKRNAIIWFFAKCIIAIVMGIVQNRVITYFWTLLMAVLILMAIVYVFISDN